MKKIFAFLLLVCIFSFCGCVEQPQPESEASQYFTGKHELKSMGKDDKGDVFFIFNLTANTVTFTWKCQQDYIISTFPVNKIRVRIEEPNQPYVLFRWRRGDGSLETMILNKIVYVVVVCKEEEWKLINVQIKTQDIPIEKKDEE